MDTSETYIKMCDKALSYLGEPQCDKGKDNGCYTCGGNWFKNGVILFRQDQLQEMAHTKVICNFPCQILMGLDNWRNEQKIHLSSFGSMEQLWLAYVMFDNYNKVWNGEDWITI